MYYFPEDLSFEEKEMLWKIAKKEGWDEYNVIRQSSKLFDLIIEGEADTQSLINPEQRQRYKFSAWLPLSLISAIDWTNRKIWKLSDAYGPPGYVPPQGFDWSGIRDSSEEAIWKMFEVAKEIFMKKK